MIFRLCTRPYPCKSYQAICDSLKTLRKEIVFHKSHVRHTYFLYFRIYNSWCTVIYILIKHRNFEATQLLGCQIIHIIIILNKWDSLKRSIVSIFDNIFNINIHLLQRHCSYFIQSTLLIQRRDEFCIGIGKCIVSYNKNSTNCYFILNRFKHSLLYSESIVWWILKSLCIWVW